VPEAVAGIVEGKAFDYGTVCSSEQTLVAEQSLREPILAALRAQKAYLCSEAEKEALARVLVRPNFQINPDCVGQAPTKLARMAGFEVPPDTSILVVELAGVGKEHPLSVEKLSPVLALRFVRNFAEALDTCEAVLRFGGLGHTCVIWSKDEERIREFGMRMPAFRVLVNTPGPHGSVGITTKLMPSMTLGCGAIGGNSTSDNVGPQHLINIKRVAWKVREAAEALPLPPYEEKVAEPVAAPVALDRAAIAAVVEQYLRERGLVPPAAPAPSASPAAVAAEIVDRFLASRGKAPASCPKEGGVCAVSPAQQPSPSTPAETTPPAPPVFIADFVCENDVRAAIQQGRKIYIGPKTIVTPAARDLGEQHGVLVMAQR
jgi:acetaldehyde dehydrogenase (acetylating)